MSDISDQRKYYERMIDEIADAHEEQLDQLEAENAKLREWCSELLRMAETHDPEWLHWPELHSELRELEWR